MHAADPIRHDETADKTSTYSAYKPDMQGLISLLASLVHPARTETISLC